MEEDDQALQDMEEDIEVLQAMEKDISAESVHTERLWHKRPKRYM